MAVGAFREVGITPLVVHDNDRGGGGEETALAALINSRVDGVLLLNRSPQFQESHVDELRRYGMSVVQVGVQTEMEDLSHYVTDRNEAYELVVDHLVGQGYGRLGLLASDERSGPSGVYQSRAGAQTRRAVLEAVNKARNAGKNVRLQIFDAPVENSPSPEIHPLYQTGYAAVKEISQRGQMPEALICQVDGWAWGAMRACAEAGLRIPEDLAITGYSNEPASSATYVPLTSVEEPFEEMCLAAVTELVSAVSQRRPTKPGRVVFPCRLVVRHSSMRPRA